MKSKKLVIVVTFCITLAAFGTVAQSSRANEGVSRQIVAIKNMLDSFAASIQARVQDVEDDVEELIDREEERTACLNASGETSIYWPRHPEADGNGCVSHEDLGSAETTNSGQGCGQETITWTGTYGNSTISCSARAVPTPHGITSTTSDPYGGECSHDTNYGTAYVLCNNGSYELQSNSFCRYNSNGEWRGDCR